MNAKQIVKWCVRCSVVVPVIVAASLETHASHSTALARSANAPPPTGCPTVPGGFSGILASVPGLLNFQSAVGYPPHSFEVNSLQWGDGRGISSPSGGSDREPSAPSISEVVVTRLSDENDPLLFNESLQGEPTDWTLYIYHSVTPNGAPACENITLRDVLISGFSTSSGGGQPQESISLNFTKITVHHFANDTSTSYDLSTQKTTSP